MLCALAGKFLNSFFTMPFLGSITHHIASEDNGWNLILVNRDNYIPADYKVQLTELSNGKKVDSRIYPELQEMFDDARAQGYSLFVREGYRTQEEQQQLMDEKIKQNVEEIHYISANAEMKNVTENKSLKAENPDFCNSEIHDPKDQENIKENKENKEMTTITVNVTGMMCGHCEAHVTKAVKEAFGVEDVVSSHEKGTTVIHAPEKLDEDKIREVIKEAGYEVTGITQE